MVVFFFIGINMRQIKEIIELKPVHASVKSFYKKAYIRIYEDNVIVLHSYGYAIMAVVGDNLYVTDLYNYSHTTARHVKEFLKQFYVSLTSKDLERLYKLNPWDGNVNSIVISLD